MKIKARKPFTRSLHVEDNQPDAPCRCIPMDPAPQITFNATAEASLETVKALETMALLAAREKKGTT